MPFTCVVKDLVWVCMTWHVHMAVQLGWRTKLSWDSIPLWNGWIRELSYTGGRRPAPPPGAPPLSLVFLAAGAEPNARRTARRAVVGSPPFIFLVPPNPRSPWSSSSVNLCQQEWVPIAARQIRPSLVRIYVLRVRRPVWACWPGSLRLAGPGSLWPRSALQGLGAPPPSAAGRIAVSTPSPRAMTSHHHHLLACWLSGLFARALQWQHGVEAATVMRGVWRLQWGIGVEAGARGRNVVTGALWPSSPAASSAIGCQPHRRRPLVVLFPVSGGVAYRDRPWLGPGAVALAQVPLPSPLCWRHSLWVGFGRELRRHIFLVVSSLMEVVGSFSLATVGVSRCRCRLPWASRMVAISLSWCSGKSLPSSVLGQWRRRLRVSFSFLEVLLWGLGGRRYSSSPLHCVTLIVEGSSVSWLVVGSCLSPEGSRSSSRLLRWQIGMAGLCPSLDPLVVTHL
jgi:hypothetical protein